MLAALFQLPDHVGRYPGRVRQPFLREVGESAQSAQSIAQVLSHGAKLPLRAYSPSHAPAASAMPNGVRSYST
ncbi:hypothetical protein GCM10009544_40680 [Streptomyces stramineus]|uniref:Uncharacterized protein n=1 Tax=Streptomyces stramineus TaxID=173861 RepID=A0ABP3K9V7_9ACTN